jgi:hypothetical protein
VSAAKKLELNNASKLTGNTTFDDYVGEIEKISKQDGHESNN